MSDQPLKDNGGAKDPKKGHGGIVSMKSVMGDILDVGDDALEKSPEGKHEDSLLEKEVGQKEEGEEGKKEKKKKTRLSDIQEIIGMDWQLKKKEKEEGALKEISSTEGGAHGRLKEKEWEGTAREKEIENALTSQQWEEKEDKKPRLPEMLEREGSRVKRVKRKQGEEKNEPVLSRKEGEDEELFLKRKQREAAQQKTEKEVQKGQQDFDATKVTEEKIPDGPKKQKKKEKKEVPWNNAFQRKKKKEKEEEKTSFERMFSKIKPHSHIHRFLHIISSFTLGGFFIGITLFLGGTALSESLQEKGSSLAFLQEGTASIYLVGGEEIRTSSRKILFGGETVFLWEGEGEVELVDGGTLRMRAGARIKIDQSEKGVVLTPLAGDFWLFGGSNPIIRTKNATFYPRYASVFFSQEEETFQIASYANPVTAEIWSSKGEKILFLLAAQKEVTIIPKNIPDDLADVRYSKLKKELRMRLVSLNLWAEKNALADKYARERYFSGILEWNEEDIFSDSVLSYVRNMLIFFPEKKLQEAQEREKNQKIAYLKEHFFESKSTNVSPYDLSDDDLRFLFAAVGTMIPTDDVLSEFIPLKSEFESRESLASEQIRVLAQARFSLLQNALLAKNEEGIVRILGKLYDDFKKEEVTDENRIRLDRAREIIADLFQGAGDGGVGENVLLAASKLDSLALEWEQGRQSIVALEIVEKNFRNIDRFLDRLQFPEAKRLLAENQELLLLPVDPNLFRRKEELQQEQLFIHQKYAIFYRQGRIGQRQLHAVIDSRQEAEKALLRLEKKEDERAAAELLKEEGEEEEKTIYDIFSEYGMLLISVSEEGENYQIEEAQLPDGTSFSAFYRADEESLSGITLGDLIIPENILLGHFVGVIEGLRAEMLQEDVTFEEVMSSFQQDWKKKEVDFLRHIDPLVIDVTKRLVRSEFAETGFEVHLKNIILVAEKEVHVTEARMMNFQNMKLSLNFHTETKLASKILLEKGDRMLPDTHFSDLSAKIERSVEQWEKEDAMKNRVQWALKNAGVDISEEDIRLSEENIHFQKGEYEDLLLSGLADGESEIFLFLSQNGTPFLKNIPFPDLKKEMQKIFSPEEEN